MVSGWPFSVASCKGVPLLLFRLTSALWAISNFTASFLPFETAQKRGVSLKVKRLFRTSGRSQVWLPTQFYSACFFLPKNAIDGNQWPLVQDENIKGELRTDLCSFSFLLPRYRTMRQDSKHLICRCKGCLLFICKKSKDKQNILLVARPGGSTTAPMFSKKCMKGTSPHAEAKCSAVFPPQLWKSMFSL